MRFVYIISLFAVLISVSVVEGQSIRSSRFSNRHRPSGRCPRTHFGNCLQFPAGTSCSHDSDFCSPGQICCPDGCGGEQCTCPEVTQFPEPRCGTRYQPTWCQHLSDTCRKYNIPSKYVLCRDSNCNACDEGRLYDTRNVHRRTIIRCTRKRTSKKRRNRRRRTYRRRRHSY